MRKIKKNEDRFIFFDCSRIFFAETHNKISRNSFLIIAQCFILFLNSFGDIVDSSCD